MFMFASKYIKCHLILFEKLIVLLLFCAVCFSLFVILQILTQAFINLQAEWQLSLALPNAPLSSAWVHLNILLKWAQSENTQTNLGLLFTTVSFELSDI